MKCVYISVPITGRKIEDVKAQIENVKYSYLNDYFILNPLYLYSELCILKGFLNEPTYEEIIGYDIKYLLRSEVVFFCKGWQNSKGCMLEFAAAKIYGKEMMFE